jgi:hypothetical protein
MKGIKKSFGFLRLKNVGKGDEISGSALIWNNLSIERASKGEKKWTSNREKK